MRVNKIVISRVGKFIDNTIELAYCPRCLMAGGDDVGYAFTSFLPGITVEIDGMKIVENGALSSRF